MEAKRKENGHMVKSQRNREVKSNMNVWLFSCQFEIMSKLYARWSLEVSNKRRLKSWFKYYLSMLHSLLTFCLLLMKQFSFECLMEKENQQ